MHQTHKLKKFRRLANHMLSLSHYNSFPIHMNMEFNAEALFLEKKTTNHSLTAILTKLMAQVFQDDKNFLPLNSYLIKSPFKRSRLIVFENISFSVALPKTFDGEPVAALYILKNTDQKSVAEIDSELRAANQMKVEELPVFKKMETLLKIPSFLYSPLFLLLKWFPTPSVVAGSSIGLTNLGQSPVQSVFPVSPKTSIFGLGGSYLKTIQREGQFVEERHMTLSLTFNHYVVDGQICSEYLQKLKTKIESLKRK